MLGHGSLSLFSQRWKGAGGGGGGVALAAYPAPATPPILFNGGPTNSSIGAAGNVSGYFEVSDIYQQYLITFSGGGTFNNFTNSDGTVGTGVELRVESDTNLGIHINGTQIGKVAGTPDNIPVTSVSVGTTIKYGRERATGDFVVIQDGIERYRLPSARITVAAGAILNNTKARWATSFGGTIANLSLSAWATTYAPLTINSTLYNVDTHNFDVVIAYYTALVPTYEISRNGGAYQDIPAYTTTGAGNATLRLPAADVGMNGRATYTLRQKNLTTSTATGVYVIPEKMILGINVGIEAINELGYTARWIDPASFNNNIAQLGEYVVAPKITASIDGAGSTVKRDTLGKVYATNGLGLTNYQVLNDTTFCSPGTWNFAFAAGVSITNSAGMTAGGITTGYTYNSVTGLGSFTVPAGPNVTFNITISAASIPVGGTGLSLTKQGVVGQFDTNAISDVVTIAKEIRFLDAASVNNANYNNRTPLLMASRSFANRLRIGEWDVETQVAFANACGCGMVYQPKHTDTDDMITGAADYIAANLVGQARFAFSNELWNLFFTQTIDSRLNGIRLGMALGSATPGTLVAEPNTFEGAQAGIGKSQAPTWMRGDWSGSVFTENDIGGVYAKLLIAMPAGSQIMLSGAGIQVYNTATAQAIGCIFNIQTGVSVSGSTGNFTIKYVSSDTQTAGIRWSSYRFKQMITLVNARFALASKPNPKYVFESWAAGGLSYIQPALDWDNLYLLLVGSHLSPGFYYGNGTAGDTLGDFNSTTYAEWTATTGKNALFDTATNPTLTARLTAAKTAYFSASGKTVTATVASATTYRDALITYNLGKAGGIANDIKMGEYEFNWHTIFQSWPDNGAAAYVATNTYVAGNVVRQAGSGLFKAVQAVPVSTPPPNATYWVSMASEADFVAGNPSDQLFTSIVLDSRHGTDIGNLINGLRNVHGGPSYFYAFLGPNISSSNYFGLIQSYTDTTAANYRYSAVKAARTLIG